MSMLLALLDHELRADRQLVAGEAHRLAGDRLRDARHLEHDPARLDDRHPVVGRALAGAHPDLRRLLGDRLVREDPDPDAAAALDVMGHGTSSRLDLAAGQPADLLGHETEVAEADRSAALGETGPAAALHLAVLDPLWHQHLRNPSTSASASGPVRRVPARPPGTPRSPRAPRPPRLARPPMPPAPGSSPRRPQPRPVPPRPRAPPPSLPSRPRLKGPPAPPRSPA